MDNGRVIAPANYERALLLEAVTLLTQSQAETESALGEQLAHTTRRMAVLEQRCDDFESRLTSIDERLGRIAADLQPPPDPDVELRVSLLRTQLERLSGRTHTPHAGAGDLGSTGRPGSNGPAGSAPPAAGPASGGSGPSSGRVSFSSVGTPSPAGTPGHVGSVGPTTPVGATSPAPSGGPVSQPVSAPAPAADRSDVSPAPAPPPMQVQTQRQSAPTPPSSSNDVWGYLGATPQDRAAVVLVGLGLVAVVYAVLVQLHFG